EVADRVVVMSNGAIEQIGTPAEVYDNPVNAFVFDFVGESNRVPVVAADDRAMFRGAYLAVDTAGLRGAGDLYFRPHAARIGVKGDAGLPATVTLVRPREGRARIEAEVAGLSELIELDVSLETVPAVGENVTIVPTHARLFPAREPDEAAA
ncbi:MAG: sulfate ABC transporter ATP-binding protein, partial [Sphingomonas sp.]